MGHEGEDKRNSEEACSRDISKGVAATLLCDSGDAKLVEEKQQDFRLWIGNLDAAITEYQLLHVLQKFGEIHKFDYLFHLSGPYTGLPRGYAFVTYKTKEGALRCLEELNGKITRKKPLVIRWARQAVYDYNHEKERLKKMLPALTLGKESEPKTPETRKRAISAIEAKLKDMERQKDGQMEFNVAFPGQSISYAVVAPKSSGLRTYRKHRCNKHSLRLN